MFKSWWVIVGLLSPGFGVFGAEIAPVISEVSWKDNALSMLLTGSRDRYLLQESSDLLNWMDTTVIPPRARFNLSSGFSQRFYRAVQAPSLPPPPPLSANDIFRPFINQVPDQVEILSEEIEEDVVVQEIRFASFEGTSEGGIARNTIFAYLAKPLDPLQAQDRKHPAIMTCHGGGLFPFRGMAVGWAKRGFVAIAPEFPGFMDLGKLRSSSRVAYEPYAKSLMSVIPNARASTFFDSVVSGLGAFNLLAAHRNVDTNALFIDGVSMGGCMTLMLAGLLDVRISRCYSLYGCGFHDIDTQLTVQLLIRSEEERREWLANLDPSARIKRIRAGVLIYAASNDFFFRPPSVNATFEAIPSEKYLCYSPNDNHYFFLQGGAPGNDGTTWGTIEPAFFLDATNRFTSPFPHLKRGGQKGHTLTFDIAGFPPGGFAFACASAPPGSSWTERDWLPLPVVMEQGRFKATVPDYLTSCDWYAGILFDFRWPGGISKMSLSSPVYNEPSLEK